MNTLPHDVCRCQGRDCDRKTECLRFVALDDFVQGTTPWTERYCPVGRESEGFIAVREDDHANQQ